jgi:aspartate carbamoyltransferase catalytic subunit
MDASAITGILDVAESMADILQRPIPRVPALRGRTVMLLFYEASTRTRHSFELACKALGADSLSLAAQTSSVSKGESLLDTLRTSRALGADCVVLRHPASGAAAFASRQLDVPVINAGDGTHAHPTQALADLFAVRRARGRIAGLRVAIVGDILHSRVARSDARAFVTMGAEVRLAGPPPLVPASAGVALGARVCRDLDAALSGADVVIALRIQRERQESGLVPGTAEYHHLWGLDPERLAASCPEALLMHPGPMNRGVEVR